MNCYNCDTLLEKDWNYCPNCKKKIKKHNKLNEEELVATDEVGKCRKCSFELNDNWNFCPVCGTSAEFHSEKTYLAVPTLAASKSDLAEVVIMEREIKNAFLKCPNCKTKVMENQPFCAECGMALGVTPVSEIENLSESGYLVWLLLGYLLPICGIFSHGVHEIFLYVCDLLSVFSMVFVLSAYPKSKVVKIAFALYLLFALVVIGGTIWLHLTCKSIGCGHEVWG